ncbi:gfo/Idh/MocA family oxidoreductase [Candidatus Fermentibacteria bacterium]|nr:gfo/Idh/MocA family oxidoreductase [Candidatus Fermentibacteria bacterium]
MANVGIVGLGYWGPNLLRNLISNRKAGTIHICDKDPAKLDRMVERYPSTKKAHSFEQMLEDDSIDAIVIATHVSSHFPMARKALQSAKHVFVEKPFASSTEEAEELLSLSQEKGLVTMVGHTFLYSPPVVTIRKIVDSGELGDIHFLTSSRVNLGLHQKDVSVIWDLAPHDFSMFFYWLNEEPSEVKAFGHDFVIEGIPDVAFIDLRFPSGIIGNVQVSWLAPSKLRRTVIVGSRKMLVYDDTQPDEKIKIYDKGVDLIEPESFGEYQLVYRTGAVISPKLDTYEPLSMEMDEFLRCVQTGEEPRANGKNGLVVVKALQRADESLQEL